MQLRVAGTGWGVFAGMWCWGALGGLGQSRVQGAVLSVATGSVLRGSCAHCKGQRWLLGEAELGGG